MIHNDLRDQLWDERSADWQPSERSAASERALLCKLCSLPNYAIGSIFFPVAAAMLGIGMLLIITDLRYDALTNPQQLLYDFGTTVYERSMIIFSLYPKSPVGVRGGSKVGHYETVGRLDARAPDQPHQTLFARDDPCMSALRCGAINRSHSKTLDNLRVVVGRYDPPPLTPSKQVDAGGALRVSARQLTRSTRLTHPGENDVELQPVRKTQRSLTSALDKAAQVAHCQAPSGGRLSLPTSPRAAAVSVPSRRASRTHVWWRRSRTTSGSSGATWLSRSSTCQQYLIRIVLATHEGLGAGECLPQDGWPVECDVSVMTSVDAAVSDPCYSMWQLICAPRRCTERALLAQHVCVVGSAW